MQIYTQPLTVCNPSALSQALTAVLPAVMAGGGIQAHTDPANAVIGGMIDVNIADNATASDKANITGIINAHDPVFLTVDKTRLKADDTERCTINVTAPKPGAAAVVLSISCNGSAPVDFPVSLAGGVGSDYFTCKDPASITIRVKNGANRSVDILTVEAA